MRQVVIGWMALSLNFTTVAESEGKSPEFTWNVNTESDGITTFRMIPTPDATVAFRGKGILDGSVARVASVLTDPARVLEWMPDTAEFKVLKKISDSEWLIYDRASVPFPFDDRDYVISFKIEFDAVNQKVSIFQRSVEDPNYPPTEHVRGFVERSIYIIEPHEDGLRSVVTMELEARLGGDIPIWLVNAFASESPRKTLQALRKQVARKDVAVRDEIESRLK